VALVIGGFEPFSLSDYPGCPSAVVFTQGCNWRCPFCHNPELLEIRAALGPRRPDLAVETVLGRLRERRGLLRGVVVSGGEPTVQGAELPGFLAAVKELGFCVKLDTNGSRPEALESLLDAGLVDYIAMDIKAPGDPGRYASLAGVEVDLDAVRRSAALIAASGIAHHFRTTWVPGLLAEADRAGILGLAPAGSRHVWQRLGAQARRSARPVGPGVARA
jgi:pyruvate formate lyase activating enzyme